MSNVIPIKQQEPDAPDEKVMTKLRCKANGSVKNSISNLRLIVTDDFKYRCRFGFDTFARNVTIDQRPLTSDGVTEMRADIGLRYEVETAEGNLLRVISLVANENKYNPLVDWLESLAWDGRERLQTWLTSTYGAEDIEVHRAFAKRFAISAVARAIQPGCKVDTVLLLVGGQGTKKSTVFSTLAGKDLFCDTAFTVGVKDAFMQTAKAWIYEVAEMSTFRSARQAAVKAFITSAVDTYRSPHRSRVEKVPRHTVFVATENHERPLDDPTGSRRFWPVALPGRLDLDWVVNNRDQFWAEAVARYKAGEQWWLTDAEEALRVRHNRAFEQVDAWTDPVESWVAKQSQEFTTHACIVGALGVAHPGRAEENQVGPILRRLGCIKRRAARNEVDGTRPWVWQKPEGE